MHIFITSGFLQQFSPNGGSISGLCVDVGCIVQFWKIHTTRSLAKIQTRHLPHKTVTPALLFIKNI
jgi:hypothetical protein